MESYILEVGSKAKKDKEKNREKAFNFHLTTITKDSSSKIKNGAQG